VESAQTEFTTVEDKRLLEQIAEVKDFRMIVITGGDPLLRKYIFKLIEHAGKLGFHIAFSTNGTLLTPSIAKGLARLGVVNFSISLDGHTPDCHESIRRKKDCFQDAINGIQATKHTGVCVQVNFTAMQQNLAELAGLIDLADTFKTDIVMVFQAIPPCRQRGMSELTPTEHIQLMQVIQAKQKTCHALIMPVCSPECWPRLIENKRHNIFTKSLGKIAFSGCGAGRGFCYVRFDGQIWPCNFIPLSAGDARQTPFNAIWKNSSVLQGFRGKARHLKGNRGDCRYQRICGGCQGRAFAHSGDYRETDPACQLPSQPARFSQSGAIIHGTVQEG
jgi:radical SAM protein with 4Fe4S-binding SPASM domain